MLVGHMMIADFVSAKKDDSIKECIRAMFEKHVGSIVIVDNGVCAGIFTERDVIRVNAQDISLEIPIEKVMTKNVLTISEDAPFGDARHIMRSRRVRHVPVTNKDGNVVGLLSIRRLFDEFFQM